MSKHFITYTIYVKAKDEEWQFLGFQQMQAPFARGAMAMARMYHRPQRHLICRCDQTGALVDEVRAKRSSTLGGVWRWVFEYRRLKPCPT